MSGPVSETRSKKSPLSSRANQAPGAFQDPQRELLLFGVEVRGGESKACPENTSSADSLPHPQNCHPDRAQRRGIRSCLSRAWVEQGSMCDCPENRRQSSAGFLAGCIVGILAHAHAASAFSWSWVAHHTMPGCSCFSKNLRVTPLLAVPCEPEIFLGTINPASRRLFFAVPVAFNRSREGTTQNRTVYPWNQGQYIPGP